MKIEATNDELARIRKNKRKIEEMLRERLELSKREYGEVEVKIHYYLNFEK